MLLPMSTPETLWYGSVLYGIRRQSRRYFGGKEVCVSWDSFLTALRRRTTALRTPCRTAPRLVNSGRVPRTAPENTELRFRPLVLPGRKTGRVCDFFPVASAQQCAGRQKKSPGAYGNQLAWRHISARKLWRVRFPPRPLGPFVSSGVTNGGG